MSLLERLVHSASRPFGAKPLTDSEEAMLQLQLSEEAEPLSSTWPEGPNNSQERNTHMSPAAKTPNPLTQRINAEARAIRRILNVVGTLDHAGRGRVLRTVIEMADEMQNQHRGGNQSAQPGESYGIDPSERQLV